MELVILSLSVLGARGRSRELLLQKVKSAPPSGIRHVYTSSPSKAGSESGV